MRKAARARIKIAVVVTIALLFCDIPLTTHAVTTQDKLNEALQQKNELEQQKEDNEDKLDDLKDDQNSLKGELNNLNSQLQLVSDNLAELERQIGDKEQEIDETTQALTQARETEKWQYDCMEKRIQFLYEGRDTLYLETFFSGVSFGDLLNFAEYLEALVEYDQKMLAEYEANRAFIEEEEARLLQEKIELDALKVSAEAEQSKVSGLISQTSGSIAQYGDQIEAAEKAAKDYEEELRKKEEEVTSLREQIAAEMALSQAAANATWRNISEVSFADGDRYLLANLIYCEAGGEPYAGQLAVGSVVINRVLSSKYPDTVVGVIYQNKQFSPVGSGRLDIALAANRATAACYQAADEAMSGITNVGTCLYFRTPIEGLTGISIGGHIFY